MATAKMGIHASGVITTSTHALGAEIVVEIALVASGPLLDDSEHGFVNLIVVVSDGWVVEDSHHIIQDLLLRDFRVVPGIDDARSDILHDSDSDLSSRFVEDV